MNFDGDNIDFREKEIACRLYQRMMDEKFIGHIVLSDDELIWKLPNGILIKVYLNLPMHEGYIATFYIDVKKEVTLTHWHPSIDEIYIDLLDINIGNTFWVVKKKKVFKALPMIMEKKQWESFSDKKRRRYEVL